MDNKIPFTINYWKPRDENLNVIDSYLSYLRDPLLQNYAKDNLEKFIKNNSTDYQKQINELGIKMGLGSNVLFHPMDNISSSLNFLNRKLEIQKIQEILEHILSENNVSSLKLRESEGEERHSLELGIKMFIIAKNNQELYPKALEHLLKAELENKNCWIILHLIGCIYLYVENLIDIKKAELYFIKATQSREVENILAKEWAKGFNHSSNESEMIDYLNFIAADSFEKAAFAAYVVGDFQQSVNFILKALDLNPLPYYKFLYSKYQTRKDGFAQNYLKQSIDECPILAYAVFKDIDLLGETKSTILLTQFVNDVDTQIKNLIDKWKKFKSYESAIAISKLQELKLSTYELKVVECNKIYKYYTSLKNYPHIKIGEQFWMKENLNVNCFRNGDPIVEAKSDLEWMKACEEGSPAWCYYNNDPDNGKLYGKLYNWHAINDSRNIAPDGWKIPYSHDWDQMDYFINKKGNSAHKLKSSNGWNMDGNGSNKTLFTAMPGGKRTEQGKFLEVGNEGNWWCKDDLLYDFFDWDTGESIDALRIKSIYFNKIILEDSITNRHFGYSIRCLKEESIFKLTSSINKKSTPKDLIIGKQKWMRNDLTVDMFRNGDVIFHAKSPQEWELAGLNKQPAWCYYNNNSSEGKLYNWYAVNDLRGLTPYGWKVPSNKDWDDLIEFLGGGDIAGIKIKYYSLAYEIFYWDEEDEEYYEFYPDDFNITEFSAKPGGFRDERGNFDGIEEEGNWWTSSFAEETEAWSRGLDKYDDYLSQYKSNKAKGFSVRCIQE